MAQEDVQLLEVGDLAPRFVAPVCGGTEFSEDATLDLHDLRGSKVVLFFYPKDDTPGCTKQACGLRDSWGEVQSLAQIFGVSIDPIQKHMRFIEKYDLPFPLISDVDKEIVQSYGVWVEKKMYGKTFMGTQRSTFVIDEDGRVAAVFPKVKPTEHVDLLLEVLSS